LDDGAEATGTQERTVFREDERRANGFNAAEILEPQAATVSGKSATFTCGADVLAGEPSGDDVDVVGEGGGVEGSDVIPDGEGSEVSFLLSAQQDAAGVGLQFNCGDGIPAK